MTIQIRSLDGVGAEITGVDLCDLSNSDFAAVREAYASHVVIFFRDQEISEDEHVACARRLGPININRFFAAHPEHPEIALVSKERDQQNNIGGGWHTDHSYDQIPAMGSILVARELPETGGNTLFASMYAAYDALSDGFQQTLSTLREWQSTQHSIGEGPST